MQEADKSSSVWKEKIQRRPRQRCRDQREGAGVGGGEEDWAGNRKETGWQMWAAPRWKALLQERNPAGPEQVVQVPRSDRERKAARWNQKKDTTDRRLSDSCRLNTNKHFLLLTILPSHLPLLTFLPNPQFFTLQTIKWNGVIFIYNPKKHGGGRQVGVYPWAWSWWGHAGVSGAQLIWERLLR